MEMVFVHGFAKINTMTVLSKVKICSLVELFGRFAATNCLYCQLYSEPRRLACPRAHTYINVSKDALALTVQHV